jgi:hypothetical protein
LLHLGSAFLRQALLRAAGVGGLPRAPPGESDVGLRASPREQLESQPAMGRGEFSFGILWMGMLGIQNGAYDCYLLGERLLLPLEERDANKI